MAERRMFAKSIVDSDAFLEMPTSSQLLYFHLSMRADDDGFINKPKTIMRMIGSKDDDMNILIARKFILPFESGVVVIKHWKIHNYIQNDRYNETKYKEEKSMLALDENKSYTLNKVDLNALDIKMDKGEIVKRLPVKRFIKPTEEEVKLFVKQNNLNVDVETFMLHYESNGWKVGRNPMKDWKATVRKWSRSDFNNSGNVKQNNKNRRVEVLTDYSSYESKTPLTPEEEQAIIESFKNLKY